MRKMQPGEFDFLRRTHAILAPATGEERMAWAATHAIGLLGAYEILVAAAVAVARDACARRPPGRDPEGDVARQLLHALGAEPGGGDDGTPER